MRNHIRREAAQSMDAAWWLVPIAFAAAALAAVAFTDAQGTDDDAATQAVTQPAVLPVAATPAAAQSQLPPPDAAAEVTEHVQAF